MSRIYFKTLGLSVFLAVFFLMPTVSQAQVAGEQAASVDALSREDQLFWQQNWRQMAMRYVHLGDAFYTCEKWNPRYPSSKWISVSQWTSENTDKKKIRQGLLVRTVSDVPERDEAEAVATTLPALRVGEFGHIHSARVVQVMGPDEMVVGDVWFVDEKAILDQKKEDTRKVQEIIAREMKAYEAAQGARNRSSSNSTPPRPPDGRKALEEIEKDYEHRMKIIEAQRNNRAISMRLKGFSTAGAIPGSRWRPVGNKLGPQLAVVAPDAQISGQRGERVIAIDTAAFRSHIEEPEFVALLEKRGMTPKSFIESARQTLREYPELRRAAKDDPELANRIPEDPWAFVSRAMEDAKARRLAETQASDAPTVEVVPEDNDWFIRKTPRTRRPG